MHAEPTPPAAGADPEPVPGPEPASEAGWASPASGNVADLERRLSFHRRLSVVLGAAAVFLGLVVLAQATSGTPDPVPAASAEPTAPADPADASDVTDPGSAAAPPPAEPTAYADSVVVRRQAEDPMALGALDAPIVLSTWTDFRCPYCASFGRTTLPQVIEEYVDAGLVRVEINDVAYFGDESHDAAVAARAAGRQGRYVEFLLAAADAAPESGQADLTREALVGLAELVGVADLDRFVADLDDPDLATAVQDSTATAQYLGVSGVPFFVVGEAALSGAYPMDVFRQILDEALAQVA